MALYARELTAALAAQQRHCGYRFELVAGEDLQEQFRGGPYPVNAVLPRLRHRRAFSNRASWVASRLLHYWRRERALLRWLRGRPDVVAVHFQEWAPWLAAPVLRRIRRSGRMAFYTVHNVVPHRYPRWVPRQLMDRWIRRACRACDGLFVHTAPLSEELSRFLGRPHPPIWVAPHGVWTVPDRPPLPPLEERLARRRLLFFGTIRRNKGLDLLLDAAEHMPGYGITIAGEPVEGDYFRDEIVPRLARLRGSGMRVDLIDRFVPDEQVGPLFAEHSAIVLPYTREFVAQSGVVFMAMAHELPVVASEAGGLRELLERFGIGVTVPDLAPQSLATAVRSLVERGARAALVEQMTAAKRAFSWDASAAATIEGYQESARLREAAQTHGCVLETSPAH
jgi:glycosyltransferase involved in cell wall biosynthesis